MEVAALESRGELGVIEAELVEDGRVEVMDVDFVFDCVEAEVVGLAVVDTAFDAAAGEPHGEGVGVVIAAIGAALGHGDTTEFADEAAVLVPGFVEEFDEGDAALDESSCEEGVVGEGALAGFGSIHFLDVLGLAGDVGDLGGDVLHAGRHFIGGDAGLDFGVADGFEVPVVEFIDGIDDSLAVLFFDTLGIGKEEDGVADGAELDAIVDGGEEAGVEISCAAGGAFGAGRDDDEGGEVVGIAAKSVGDP